MSELICPNCGSKVVLPERSEFVSGLTLSKEGNNTYYLHMEKENKNMAEQFFTVKTPEGRSMKMKMVDNGAPEFVGYIDDDTIKDVENEIAGADIYDPKIGRRWVMAQTFDMLGFKRTWTKGYKSAYDGQLHTYTITEEGWTDALKAKGFNYMWKALLTEVSALKHITDREYLTEREMFFNKEVIANIIEGYILELKVAIDKLPDKKCKGVPYKRLRVYGDVFNEDLNKKVYGVIRNIACKVRKASTYAEVERILKKFINNNYIRLNYNTPMVPEFVNAYKGAGAYYTMQNMICYHGCRFNGMDKDGSLKYVRDKARSLESYDYYKLHGALKQLIEDSDFKFTL